MRYPEGMAVDPAQLPRELKKPTTQPGQPPLAPATAPGRLIGYLIDGKLYRPDDVQIVREAP